MGHRLDEIAAALGAEAFGAVDLEVTGLAEPASAGPDQLAVAMSAKFLPGLAEGQARAAVLAQDTDWQALGLEAAIVVARPRYALSGLTRRLDQGPEIAPGLHQTALIDPEAKIGAGASVGPFVVIGRGARIGANARIAEHVSIGADVGIGDDALIHPGARIGARVQIGHRVIIHPGAVIGGDGFSFVTPEKSTVETARETLGTSDMPAAKQSWARIHSLGAVTLGDDVEIGPNNTIDRGTIANTTIGDGTKLDSAVHVGHNVRVGRDCLLCGQTAIGGSTVIGDRVVLGGQTGISDNIIVGDDVVTAGNTTIFSNVPSGRMMMGTPAVKMDQQVKIYKAMRRLPRIMESFEAMQKAVFKRGQND
ncbi:UDP-3-O-(3-hydroxymyristoyl)glucosamine N-acyltransferase [Rhodophyticola sp. CCM32]|uniref:UDP-3-O-(3-hydroxymyristoyl)glucosamine N-acyltransferase n=1 Tax=Rhodophyticola sp. CCM32 TaxID=2916397 RepID=UPI00107F78F1|nr:UDP-3-O-(3-hydroxymyristoyl)glucosamine N-acyltransferase [Rhodophyticola sp. CCM32]QBY00613.1 UDP-3-O-(3-hydroxymyristoyl)glucosamine N-acyltransferase [Rhodophyticola sp. CCM32]